MKLKDIKPKHLVLGDVFDDFANATDKVDFSKEDLCCQLVGLTSVYYWINTESVWGPLGFIWENYNYNGYFSKSNINFTTIPKIPDSERHKGLNNIFRNISKPLVFLDSGWGHIQTFHTFNNGDYLIDWYCDSISNLKNTICYNRYDVYQRYIIHGNLSKTDIAHNIYVTLIEENRNNLNLRPVKNITHNLNDSMLEDREVFDMREFVKIDTLYTGSNNNLTLNLTKNYKRYILECYYQMTNGFNIRCDSYNSTPTQYKDKITFILRDDLLINSNVIKPVHLVNNNNCYAKEVEYVNLNKEVFNSIDYYHRRCVFVNDTPEITQELVDFCTNAVFYECYFYNKYKYGKLRTTDKLFASCKAYYPESSIIKKAYRVKVNSLGHVSLEEFTNIFIIDVSSMFEIEYTKEDAENNRNAQPPTVAGTSMIPNLTYYDIKCPYFKNSGFTSTGTVEYFDTVPPSMIVADKEESVIINNSCKFYQSFGDTSVYFYSMSNILKENQIIFRTNRDNITDNKNYLNSSSIWKVYKLQNIDIPYIIRNHSIINETSPIYKPSAFLPNLDTEALIYNVNVSFTEEYSSQDDKDKFQHVLDSIITVGDVTDSKNKTIRLLSEYYQAMKEETKNRLISDGYTIIETI